MSEPFAFTADDAPRGRELMAFTVGAQEFCVDVGAVRELRGWSPSTPLPHAPDYILGVINLRGTVLPILDVRARLGLGLTNPTPRHVVMVVNIGRQQVGLLVDGVCEILVAPADAIQPAPDLRADPVEAFLGGIVAVEGRMIGLLRLEPLLPPAEVQAA